MESHNSEKELIHRKFELERVILFSDAVFAIAITLLIIDVRFPELPVNLQGIDYWHLFRPTVISFFSLCLSFFFIGSFWARHLKLFKFLKQYDQGLIIRNLFFLFFIVVFPFVAETMAANIREDFVWPMLIYLTNIAGCSLMHAFLCNYIFFKRPNLSIAGHEQEKKYIFLRSKYISIMLISVSLLALCVAIIFPNNYLYVLLCFYIMPVIAFRIRKKLKKFKPATSLDDVSV
jgi:uncharacterized membrane protein